MAIQKTVQILKSGTTKIKNHNLISRDELETIKQTIVECLEKYDLYNLGSTHFTIGVVEISKRLKTTAGNCGWQPSYAPTWARSMDFEIKLAYNNYVEFGFESMLKTLKHEMAHLIEWVLYNTSSHSERFKRICVDLGGHMNGKMAGARYADSATKDYCKSTSKKIKYTCGCGMHFMRARRISGNTLRAKCRTCNTLVMDMKVEVMR